MGLALQVPTQYSSLPPLTEADGKPAQAAKTNNVAEATTISARCRRLHGRIDGIVWFMLGIFQRRRKSGSSEYTFLSALQLYRLIGVVDDDGGR
jgi:hypothetical protein